MIDLTINEEQLKRTVQRAKEKNIIIPTFAEQENPELVPQQIKDKLKNVGLWDINSYNLFRINWKNEPVKKGGQFGGVN
ncbi:MAG: pyridoxal-5-phosphate-dependent protein subunit beta, partial [Candidatus Atribacteria bacterium]|nr:pyridoxal-5-phosphate-dependent protein subunit beta [Candidatus Atribacteria bacterium]